MMKIFMLFLGFFVLLGPLEAMGGKNRNGDLDPPRDYGITRIPLAVESMKECCAGGTFHQLYCGGANECNCCQCYRGRNLSDSAHILESHGGKPGLCPVSGSNRSDQDWKKLLKDLKKPEGYPEDTCKDPEGCASAPAV